MLQPTFTGSLHASRSRLSQSSSTQTINSRAATLSEPPSYLSPAVYALKRICQTLTPPSNARTKGPFKPRSATKGATSYQLRQFAEATLGNGSLRKVVKLPEGEDLNEWLAVNGMSTRIIAIVLVEVPPKPLQ